MAKKDRPQLPDGPKERHITTYGPPVLAWDRSWSFNEYVYRLRAHKPRWFQPTQPAVILDQLGLSRYHPWHPVRRGQWRKRQYSESRPTVRRVLRVHSIVTYNLSRQRWCVSPLRRIVHLLRSLPRRHRMRLLDLWTVRTEWLLWQHVSIREGKRKKTSRQARIVRRSSRH